MITHAPIGVELTQPTPRRRRKSTLLVVGGERATRLASAARSDKVWAVDTLERLSEPALTTHWNEVLVDAAFLEQLRRLHPEILRAAERVWVVPPGDNADPFAHPLPIAGRVVKRSLDIVVALIGLLLVLPVMVATMVAVRLDSPGPSLFGQARVGVNGRRFRLYKLRTMHVGNDDRAHRNYVAGLIAGKGKRCDGMYKLTHDPRITRVGRFLRRYSLDEVPQLWNVLKGDMSLVGPRPPLPHETDLYPAGAWDRLRVKPGITGLWQVSGRCETSFDEMVSLDVRYWRDWSLVRDVAILLRTPMAVISGRGAA